MIKHNVAVYGTLLSGLWNHGLLEGSKLITPGQTAEKMKMTVNVIPYVSKKEEISSIKVEVYEVSDSVLSGLDHLEGHPTFYKREKIDVLGEDGNIHKCWIYLCDASTDNLVEDGDYKGYRTKKGLK